MKLAIFISGPVRYVDKVVARLNELKCSIGYDIFIHLWKEDNSNKSRLDETSLISAIQAFDGVKSVIIEEPIDARLVEGKYGNWTATHSSVTGMFGMFVAINKLIGCLRSDLNFDSYTHILRLRTDVALFDEDFFNKVDFNSNKIYVSENMVLPPHYVSDHIMLARIQDFEKIWCYSKFSQFEKQFSNWARNPEFYLTAKVNKMQKVNAWERYADYHIVYNPTSKRDPDVLNDFQKKNGIDAIFHFSHDKSSRRKVKIFNENLRDQYKNYYNISNKIKRVVKRLLNKKVVV